MPEETTYNFKTKQAPRLTKRFVTLGTVLLVTSALLMAAIDRRSVESEIDRWAEANNAALTVLIANSIWPRYADFIDRGRRFSSEALQNAPETQRLLADIRSLVVGLDILKVKLYDASGTTIFSSQTSQIGADYSNNERFVTSMTGIIVSELEWRQEFDSIGGPVTERWVCSSYVPVRTSGNEGEILGIAEIYKDVTMQRTEAQHTLFVRHAIIGAALTILFAILTLIVWKSDLRLDKYHKREFAFRTAAAEADAKSEAKSRFLANMSHEIRTPMNGVLGMANLLSKTSLDARQQQLLITIRQSGETLLSLINSILDLSKIESGELTLELSRFNIVDCVNEVVDLLLPIATEKGIGFRRTIEIEKNQQVLGDRPRLKQILINLAANAIKFTDVGEINLRVALTEKFGDRLRIRFEVHDTGIGIAEDQREHVFNPFFQANGIASSNNDGTGLGLSVASELVRMMGGEIGCHSETGKGSTFWFEILFDGVDVGRQGTKVSGTDVRRNKCAEKAKILLVEDNDVNLFVAQETLIGLGYTVDAVMSGQEAISVWESGSYQLILMDIRMPGIDGREATRTIRTIEQERGLSPIPIIGLSAHAFDSERDKCLSAGMNDYMSKPFSEETLYAMLNRYIAPSSETTDDQASKEFTNKKGNKDHLVKG